LTLAELMAGPSALGDTPQSAEREADVLAAQQKFTTIAFHEPEAEAYGRIYAAIVAKGRKARGAHAVDLMIAATALAHQLPLYTRNPEDFDGLGELIEIVPLT
jgi:predicted nucleic acid-binding protein